MAFDVRYNPEEIDGRSSIPTSHLSFFITQLLPTRLVGKFRCETQKVDENDEVIKELLEEGIQFISTGSLSEGLNMPAVCNKASKENIHFESNTDIDVMRVETAGDVTFFREKLKEGNYVALADTSGMHASYAKLIKPNTVESQPEYIPSRAFQKWMVMQLIPGLATSLNRIEINGPAVTTFQEQRGESSKTKSCTFTRDKTISIDQVLALPCKEWPPQATDWIERQKKSQWMKTEMIDSLVADGCHFVAAHHRLSTEPDVEWRASFAATEGRIAREVITDTQRQAYVYLKILYNHKLKAKEVITSYHLKTIFLYACENVPEHKWEENLGACVLYVLYLLIECVTKQRLPNFFIPENNLIDYLTDIELKAISESIEEIRTSPIAATLEFLKDKVVGLGTYEKPFEEVMQPLLTDMKQYKEHRDIRRSVLQAFIPSLFNNLTQHMAESGTNFTESVHLAMDLYSLLKQYNFTEETFGEFVYSNIANHNTNVRNSAYFVERAIEMHPTDESFDYAKSNLGCLFHAGSYRQTLTSQQRQECLEKAEAAFKAKAGNGDHVNNCDYALLLMKLKRFGDAATLLEKMVQDNDTTQANVYDASELMTLDHILQREIIEHKTISVPSVSLAYYLLISCLLSQGRRAEDGTQTLIDGFRQHTAEIKLPRTYALFGYICMLIKDWSMASEAFHTAVKTNNGPEYTRALKMQKYCDEQLKKTAKA